MQKMIGVPESVKNELSKVFDDFPNGMYMSYGDLIHELIKEHNDKNGHNK